MVSKDGRFKLKYLVCRGSFRASFTNNDPPLPFTWVYDDLYNGGLVPCPQIAPVPVRDIPHTTLSEKDVSDVFSHVSCVKQNINSDISHWSEMTEREFVNTLFKKDYLGRLRLALIQKFNLKQIVRPAGASTDCHYLPSKVDHLFVSFEPINWTANSAQYKDGPTYVLTRHKLIKYTLETLCPFITVAIHDNLATEKALSKCLPCGSKGKGVEVFHRGEEDKLQYAVRTSESTEVVFNGSDGTLCVPDRQTTPTPNTVSPLGPLKTYLDYTSMQVNPSMQLQGGSRKRRQTDTDGAPPPKADDYFWDPAKQMAFIASQYVKGATDVFFQKGAVVFANHEKTDPFATLDFCNFYATVAIRFNLDPFVTKVLGAMTELRRDFPGLKTWIVSLIGKSLHYDPRFFHRVKQLSVAVMLDTINKQRQLVVGATTDGLMVNAHMLPARFMYPRGFPIKIEFLPSDLRMVHNGPNNYVGISAEAGMVHRGFVSRLGSGQPEWYYDVVSILLRRCMDVFFGNHTLEEARATATEEIGQLLNDSASVPTDYSLPDSTKPSPTVDKHPAVVYYINDLCAGVCQFFACVDEHVLPLAAYQAGDQSRVIQTQNGWCLKKLSGPKYIDVMEDKIKRVARMFAESPQVTSLCETVFGLVVGQIKKVLSPDRGMYPGGVDY